VVFLTIQAHPNVSEDSLHLHDQQFMDKAIRLELPALEDEALQSCEHREPTTQSLIPQDKILKEHSAQIFRNSRHHMCDVKQVQYRGSIKRQRTIFSRHCQMAPDICASVLIAFSIRIRLSVQVRLLVLT
jgi:hypothetical protein